MPQLLLPLIPEGASQITPTLSVVHEGGNWTYFVGVLPVFAHAEDDQPSFRMFTAKLVCQGACQQVDIIRTFGVSKNSVLRSVQKYREGGVESFYRPRKVRGPSVLTPEVRGRAQELLDAGQSPGQVAQQLTTLRPVVGHEMPLASAAESHAAVMSPGAKGKIVLVP